MGEHLCTVPNVEPEFSRMPIFKSRAKNSSYEGWYADIDTAVILEINRLAESLELRPAVNCTLWTHSTTVLVNSIEGQKFVGCTKASQTGGQTN